MKRTNTNTIAVLGALLLSCAAAFALSGCEGAEDCSTIEVTAVRVSLQDTSGADASQVLDDEGGVAGPFVDYRRAGETDWNACGTYTGQFSACGGGGAFGGTIEVRATYDELDYVYGSVEVAHDGCHPITEYVELVIDPPLE